MTQTLTHGLGTSSPDTRDTARRSVVVAGSEPGDAVEKGAPLLILEAMKMEHTISAPGSGVVEHVYFRAGDQVKEGAELVSLGKT